MSDRVPGIGGRHGETGQTLVFSVVLLTVLIMFAGLVIDGGNFMYQRRQMQGTADAAALAGARELPDSQAMARVAAQDYAENRNDDFATLDDVTFSGNNQRITLFAERTVDGPFLGFFGVDAPTIRAKAVAERAQVIGMTGVLPFAAVEGQITGMNMFNVHLAPGQNNNGNFGSVQLPHTPAGCTGDPSGASGYRQEIIGSFGNGLITCGPDVGGQIQSSEPGNMVGPTQQGLNERFGCMPNANWPPCSHSDTFADTVRFVDGRWVVDKPNSPRIGYIPIIRGPWPNGASQPITVVDYVMVYIGRVGTAGEPPWTRTGGDIRVWMTPIPGAVLPSNVQNPNLGTTWNPASLAPTVIHLVE